MAEEGQAVEQPSVLDRLTSFVGQEEEAAEEVSDETQAVSEEEQASEEAPEEAKEEEGPEIDEDAPFVKVRFKTEGGADQEETLSIRQLRDGFMMQKDYQRKTAEVARARETLTREVEEAVAQDRNQYIQSLQVAEQALMAMVAPELQSIDMEQLAQTDPAKAVSMQARAQKLSQVIQGFRMQAAQAQQQAMQRAAQESIRALSDPITGINGWNDELYSSILRDGSRSYGFKPEEVANVVDHRMIRVLHDALQFQKAKQAKPVAKPAPKVLKPGAPQGKADLQAREDKQLRDRLKKSGDVRDAAALYLKRMKGTS